MLDVLFIGGATEELCSRTRLYFLGDGAWLGLVTSERGVFGFFQNMVFYDSEIRGGLH